MTALENENGIDLKIPMMEQSNLRLTVTIWKNTLRQNHGFLILVAQRNHRVVLADLSPKLLEIGRRKITEASVSERVEEIVEGNVCDLSHWDDNYFDAVLCLGPYYHLPNSEDRQKATSEIARVLGSGGLLYA